MVNKSDVFSIDQEEARELLHLHYVMLNDPRWRFQDSQDSGVPVEAINGLFRTGRIETRYVPILYKQVFGEISIEDAARGLRGLEEGVSNG
jgi:hypothetical protein